MIFWVCRTGEKIDLLRDFTVYE